MTDTPQQQSGSAHWLTRHPRIASFAVFLLVGVAYFAYQMFGVYDSLPDLPSGPLQMVGLSHDGARFVALDGDGFKTDVNRVVVLVTFDVPLHVAEGDFTFESKRETIDCARKEIRLEGAVFYDDQGHNALSRVFDKKPQPFKPIDTETTLVCDHQVFAEPQVTGFQTALAQTRSAISRAESSE